VLEREADQQLEGIGNASLGEWREWSGKAFHLRRRLSAAEQIHIGLAVDIRGTDEARMRLGRVGNMLRLAPAELVREEMTGTKTD
jgi:hypothetical protein